MDTARVGGRSSAAPTPVHFTAHALDRLAERGFSPRDVELVLAVATRRVRHTHGTTSHHGITLDGRAMVVVTESDDHDRVVTVMELA